jgi:Domain of unknown function (DUF4365)
MIRSKRKSESQVIGEEGIRIIKGLLPAHWTPREYQPDYGIDLAVELFEQSGHDKFGRAVYDTLGEHLFLQVKACDSLKVGELKVRGRTNVELVDAKIAAVEDGNEAVVSVFPFQMETPELVTVQRMGAAVPVLLTLVDVGAGRAYFVCLNDYIDKVLLPIDPDYAEQESKVVYVPERNHIVSGEDGLVPLRFYAKRAKLMAAFEKFRYQRHQLDYVDNEDLRQRAAYFSQILLRFDFWKSCDWWRVIAHLHQALASFSESGSPGLMRLSLEATSNLDLDEPGWTDGYSSNREYSRRELMQLQEIRQLWDQLANVGNVFEEVCREWFLPTSLGLMCS